MAEGLMNLDSSDRFSEKRCHRGRTCAGCRRNRMRRRNMVPRALELTAPPNPRLRAELDLVQQTRHYKES
jgi:hypothetical protein